MVRALWLPVAALLFCVTSVHAQPPAPYAPSPMAAPPMSVPPDLGGPRAMSEPPSMYGPRRSSGPREAAATVSAAMDKLFDFMGSNEVPNQLQTAAYLDREIAPYFDFDYMARFVSGPAWQQMDAEQRKALAAKLESRILGGLASNLYKYSEHKVRYLRPQHSRRGSVDVQVGLATRGTYRPTRLVFRLYRGDGGWKVFDVLSEGQSMLAYYRESFEQRAKGPMGGPMGQSRG